MNNSYTSAQGFTLIELLVVVLIIGILSSVALPQYTKTVEKSRISEALSTIKTIREQMDLYVLQNGYPSDSMGLKDQMSVDLTGGMWESDRYYTTKNFQYYFLCTRILCYFEVIPVRTNRGTYTLYGDNEGSGWKNYCASQNTDWGLQICKSLIGQGWEFVNAEI